MVPVLVLMQVLIILRGAGSIPSSSQSDNPANEPIYVVDGAITK